MQKIAIILLNYNSTDETIVCINSLQEMPRDTGEITVVVVDNNSHADQVKKLDRYIVDIEQKKDSVFAVKYIKNNSNLGFTGGNNTGMEYALQEKMDLIMLLNNDTIVHKIFLTEMVKELESSSKIGVVVPKIYFAPGHEFHKERYTGKDSGKVIWYAGGTIDWENAIGHHVGVDEVDDGTKYSETGDTEYATGACMLIRTSVLEKVGLFDPDYFLYYEDSDLSMRIKNAGFRIRFAPDAIVWHKNAGSTGGSGSGLQDYFISRNRMLFGMKYAPLRTKAALIRESIRIQISGRKWQKKGVRDFYLRRFGKGSYPFSD